MLITYKMGWNGKEAGLIAGAIGLTGLILELPRFYFPKINQIFLQLTKHIAREEEKNKLSGLTYYCLGVALSFYFFDWHLANLAIFYLIFADPIGSLIGQRFGKKKFIKNKSYAGCLGFFGVCLLINLIYGNYFGVDYILEWRFLFIAAIIGMLSEILVILDDNFSIPVLSSVTLQLIFI